MPHKHWRIAVLVSTLALVAGVFSQAPIHARAITASATTPFTFSPPTYVDYKRLGGEPTTTVDRYPFVRGSVTSTNFTAACGNTTANQCRPDLAYVSAPEGIGSTHFSYFWKSNDKGQSFRVTQRTPDGLNSGLVKGPGGGDTHQAIGQVTHSVFMVDLAGVCVTSNVSRNLGESFVGDPVGCGGNPGGIDDRPWVAADELAAPVPGGSTPTPACLNATPVPACGNVYISFINFTNQAAPSIVIARSTHDGNAGTFASPVDNPCNFGTANVPINPLDSTPTACPDPGDSQLQLAGPVVADLSPSSPHYHCLYIPFVRAGGRSIPGGAITPAPPYLLYLAKSCDTGLTWTRQLVSDRGVHDPINIFVQLTVDKAGNLYYDWAETEGDPANTTTLGGTTRVYYAYSTDGGTTWSGPILLSNPNNSAVMPWMQAGDRGKVDAVWYQSNSPLNPNTPNNPSMVWNVVFAQSLNALNPGSWTRQIITTHPNHIGQVCTNGLNCNTSGNGNRNVLDFFTVDIDHYGLAHTTWSDDNNSRNDTRQFFSRQLAGPTILGAGSADITTSWPVHGNTVIDPRGDVYDAAGFYDDSCPGMDLLRMIVSRDTSGNVTVRLTVNGPPTPANALACSRFGYPTGIWGAGFWARTLSTPACSPYGCWDGDNFYLAHRDLPDTRFPTGEAGRVIDRNDLLTSNELRPEFPATSSVSCSPPTGPCTITVTANFSTATGKPAGYPLVDKCANLDSVTGLSLYYQGKTDVPDPATRIQKGNSDQADVTAALLFRGCTGQISGGGGGGTGGGGCDEADGSGDFQGQQSSGHFESDEDGCKDGDQNQEQYHDSSTGEDFHSTSTDSTVVDPIAHTITVTGVGVNQLGIPVTFVIVEQAATAAGPATYLIQLSDGYVNSGALTAGSITA